MNSNNTIDPEHLLELVRDRRAIYDFNLKAYSNKPIVDALWAEVANELGSTVAEVKAKWTCLRSSYARSRRESKKSSQFGLTNKRKKTWYLSDAMSFLDDFMYQYKKDDLNDENGVDMDDADLNDNEDNDHDQDSNLTGENDEVRSTIRRLSDHRHLRDYSFRDHKISEPMVEIRETEIMEMSDPDLLFFRSIIPDLKKLSCKKKRKFKEKLLSWLNQALDSEEEDSRKTLSNGVPSDDVTCSIKMESQNNDSC